MIWKVDVRDSSSPWYGWCCLLGVGRASRAVRGVGRGLFRDVKGCFGGCSRAV